MGLGKQHGARTIEGRNRAIVSGRTNSRRKFPVGAEVVPGKGVHFRVWAPASHSVAVQLSPDLDFGSNSVSTARLKREGKGYFSGLISSAAPDDYYKLKLSSGAFPDPASRFQPEGPHGPSQIIDPNSFRWSDQAWKGVSRKGQVIYEMHIGTFTPEGTWKAAAAQLEELARIGITILEIMPVADFPGRFGWGYDGVNLFAPTRLYGTPDDFRGFVDQAHRLRMGVILDVVYNHLGPDGNYITKFSEDYFTDKYHNEWGQPLNFDGKNSKPVREFFITNARYWIREFHLDGLRLDATQQIFDGSTPHVLAEISRETRAEAMPRGIYLVAENEPQQTHLVRDYARGGCGLDALWNDDFHHSAMVALTGRNEAYYSDYRGNPQEFISALKWGFLFQGQFHTWQKQPRGGQALDLEPNRFVNFLQNHDQVANSLYGGRLNQHSSPGQLKAMTALFLLAPGTPMLFQGQEYGATTPFFYFADHEPKLAKLVAKGRKEFLHQFKSLACKEIEPCFIDPESEETFLRSKLDFSERAKNRHSHALHQDLLRLRREDPVFRKPRRRGMDGAVLGSEAFLLRFFGRPGDDRLVLINLGVDLPLDPAPEPLLAPIPGKPWEIIWSSESPAYGGCGTPPFDQHGFWQMPGHCAIVLGPGHKSSKNGKTNSTH